MKKRNKEGGLSWKEVLSILFIVGVLAILVDRYRANNQKYMNSTEYIYTSQKKQARATVKRTFEESIEGDSYKAIAWGEVKLNDSEAGTGTKNWFFGETGTPPSKYSITHRARMKNEFGNVVTFDVRIFFTDRSCREWAGMEYMNHKDPSRHLMTEE